MKKRSKKNNSAQVFDTGLFSEAKIKLGLIITVISIFVITGATINKVLNHYSNFNSKVEITSEPAPIAVKPASESSTLALKQETDSATKTIKASSIKNIEVQKNDNFWKISKRACGKGNYYLAIKEDTGYENKALQPGDIITIDCSRY